MATTQTPSTDFYVCVQRGVVLNIDRVAKAHGENYKQCCTGLAEHGGYHNDVQIKIEDKLVQAWMKNSSLFVPLQLYAPAYIYVHVLHFHKWSQNKPI